MSINDILFEYIELPFSSIPPECVARTPPPERKSRSRPKLPLKAVVNEKGECQVDLLEYVLEQFWAEIRLIIKDCKTEPATAKGTNFTSDTWRVTFTYTLDDKPKEITDSVVVKTKPSNKELKKLMHTSTAFANEIYAYDHIIPQLDRVARTTLRVPLLYHGNQDSLVMEDMNKRSFRNINKKLADEWSLLWSAITEMAKLHASSIVMQKLAPEKFEPIIKTIKKVPFGQTTPLGEKQSEALDTIIAVLEKANSPETTKHIEFLESMRKNAWQRQKEVIEEEVPIRVINHGSIWINNLMYRDEMVTLLDWQHIVYSSPALDLSFFLYVNIDSDFLINKKQKLIDFYLMNLHQFIYDATVNKCTLEEVNKLLQPLTSEWINAELHRFCIYGYMMAQWITPVFYWSEAVFQTISDKGGFESMSMEERMKHMTTEQTDRMIKLAKFFCMDSIRVIEFEL